MANQANAPAATPAQQRDLSAHVARIGKQDKIATGILTAIVGFVLLLLAANYSVHFFAGLRFRDVNAAILMNLSTYFLCYWLFSSALTTLLDRFYLTRKRFLAHIYRWLAFTALSGVVLLWLPDGIVQNIGLLVMALWLMVYGVVLARRLIIAYRRACASSTTPTPTTSVPTSAGSRFSPTGRY